MHTDVFFNMKYIARTYYFLLFYCFLKLINYLSDIFLWANMCSTSLRFACAQTVVAADGHVFLSDLHFIYFVCLRLHAYVCVDIIARLSLPVLDLSYMCSYTLVTVT